MRVETLKEKLTVAGYAFALLFALFLIFSPCSPKPSNSKQPQPFLSPKEGMEVGGGLLYIDRAEVVNNYQGVGILTPSQRSEFVALVSKRLHEK